MRILEITRRDWLELTAVNTLACVVSARRARGQTAARSVRERRILQIIQAYSEQGFHRTGTPVDRASANWLRDEVRQAGLTPSLEPFTLARVDPLSASLVVRDRRVDGLPLFDGAFTDERGVDGRLGPLASDAEIGLAESIPNAAGAGALGDARRKNRHKAIVCLTRGSRPGLCPSNADSFLQPFGPPVLQVASEHAGWLQEDAQRHVEVRVVAHVKRTTVEAFNVTARVTGADPALPPLVIMTPRSGWYLCASERGGGLACWLELMRILRETKPARDVLFVASSGHELGHLGINAFVDRRPEIVPRSIGWMHLGANIGAARRASGRSSNSSSTLPPSASLPQAQGNTVQASDDELERMLAQAMTSTNLTIDVRMPRGRVPGGEAEVVEGAGATYRSSVATICSTTRTIEGPKSSTHAPSTPSSKRLRSLPRRLPRESRIVQTDEGSSLTISRRSIILFFTIVEAGWMAFDGGRALLVGSLITPQSGPYAGQVGPWRFLVEPLGVEPNGRVMHWIFAAYGCAWLVIAGIFAIGRAWAWLAMMVAAVGSLWFLPFGTIASVIQITLLLAWRRQP